MSEENAEDTRSNRSAEYGHLVSMVQYEGNLLWTVLGAFLVAEAVLLGLLGSSMADVSGEGALCRWDPLVFVGGILGLLVCVPWWACYHRNSTYYEFRMAQARRLEDDLSYDILSSGKKLSEGHWVPMDGRCYRMPWMSRTLRTRRSGRALIVLFGVAFAALIVVSGPWW
jgi:hypothetical protein